MKSFFNSFTKSKFSINNLNKNINTTTIGAFSIMPIYNVLNKTFATKMRGTVTKNKKDSAGRRLGFKKLGEHEVHKNDIILRQRGYKYKPGENIIVGRDHTFHAATEGKVFFTTDPYKNYKETRVHVIQQEIPNRLIKPPLPFTYHPELYPELSSKNLEKEPIHIHKPKQIAKPNKKFNENYFTSLNIKKTEKIDNNTNLLVKMNNNRSLRFDLKYESEQVEKLKDILVRQSDIESYRNNLNKNYDVYSETTEVDIENNSSSIDYDLREKMLENKRKDKEIFYNLAFVDLKTKQDILKYTFENKDKLSLVRYKNKLDSNFFSNFSSLKTEESDLIRKFFDNRLNFIEDYEKYLKQDNTAEDLENDEEEENQEPQYENHNKEEVQSIEKEEQPKEDTYTKKIKKEGILEFNDEEFILSELNSINKTLLDLSTFLSNEKVYNLVYKSNNNTHVRFLELVNEVLSKLKTYRNEENFNEFIKAVKYVKSNDICVVYLLMKYSLTEIVNKENIDIEIDNFLKLKNKLSKLIKAKDRLNKKIMTIRKNYFIKFNKVIALRKKLFTSDEKSDKYDLDPDMTYKRFKKLKLDIHFNKVVDSHFEA